MKKPRYYVTTWDTYKEDFTPQAGVRTGPYSLFGLRKALRSLRQLGYTATRFPRYRSEAPRFGHELGWLEGNVSCIKAIRKRGESGGT